MVGGPSLIRVTSELRSATGQLLSSSELDLSRDPGGWEEGADRWVRSLYPSVRGATVLTASPPAPERPRSVGPWVLFGGAAALVVPTALLAGSSASAAEEARSTYQLAPAHEASLERAEAHALAANLCLGAAILAASAGVVWLLAW